MCYKYFVIVMFEVTLMHPKTELKTMKKKRKKEDPIVTRVFTLIVNDERSSNTQRAEAAGRTNKMK